jgi:hypothetical protein
MTRRVLTTQNCPALVPVDNVKAGARGGRMRRFMIPRTANCDGGALPVKKPAVKKKSPAQAAAGIAFAAGGRAAQARKRAAAKKAGKPTVTKAQHQAALKWAAAGRAAQAARRTGKIPVKKAAAVAPGLAARLPGWWLPGCNDVAPTCAATAVANHLLASTGLAMSEDQVMALHALAGGTGEDAVAIADVLEAIQGRRMGAGNGSARLHAFTPVDTSVILTGLVVAVSLPHARHAVLSHPQGMVSWGQVLPWDGEPEEAWALEWT